MFEEFIKCFRPFKRAAMMLMWPTVKMSLTPLLYRVIQALAYHGGETVWKLTDTFSHLTFHKPRSHAGCDYGYLTVCAEGVIC